MRCFSLINSVLVNLLCVWILLLRPWAGTLIVIMRALIRVNAGNQLRTQNLTRREWIFLVYVTVERIRQQMKDPFWGRVYICILNYYSIWPACFLAVSSKTTQNVIVRCCFLLLFFSFVCLLFVFLLSSFFSVLRNAGAVGRKSPKQNRLSNFSVKNF